MLALPTERDRFQGSSDANVWTGDIYCAHATLSDHRDILSERPREFLGIMPWSARLVQLSSATGRHCSPRAQRSAHRTLA